MADLEFLSSLEAVIAERLRDPPPGSYTAKLAGAGVAEIAKKIGEEGVELALAGVTESDARVRDEAADVLYHVLVMLAVRGVPFSDVVAELERRHRSA